MLVVIATLWFASPLALLAAYLRLSRRFPVLAAGILAPLAIVSVMMLWVPLFTTVIEIRQEGILVAVLPAAAILVIVLSVRSAAHGGSPTAQHAPTEDRRLNAATHPPLDVHNPPESGSSAARPEPLGPARVVPDYVPRRTRVRPPSARAGIAPSPATTTAEINYRGRGGSPMETELTSPSGLKGPRRDRLESLHTSVQKLDASFGRLVSMLADAAASEPVDGDAVHAVRDTVDDLVDILDRLTMALEARRAAEQAFRSVLNELPRGHARRQSVPVRDVLKDADLPSAFSGMDAPRRTPEEVRPHDLDAPGVRTAEHPAATDSRHCTISVVLGGRSEPIDLRRFYDALNNIEGVRHLDLKRYDRRAVVMTVETSRNPTDLPLQEALAAVFDEGMTGSWVTPEQYSVTVGVA